LFKATAYIVGPVDGPGAALRDLATGLQFEAVLPYAGAAAADQQTGRTPLLFFLVAAVDRVTTLEPFARQVRFHPGKRVRFSPIIYFSESPLAEAIQTCVALGFDDVLTLPFTPERLRERLTRQVNRSLNYYETPSYFGPDRRRDGDARADERRAGGRHRRFEIIRTAAAGVHILRDDMRAA